MVVRCQNSDRHRSKNPNPAFIMTTKILHQLTALALLAGINQAAAQTFTNLHSSASGSDGGNPYGALVLSGTTLYGTANSGGSHGNGTIFAINADGTGFTNLHSFATSDGINPYDGLILSGNTLYGTGNQVAVTALAPCSPSIRMALVLRTCIV